jgi:CubicO group peptidase (beta-lactamase class C family)
VLQTASLDGSGYAIVLEVDGKLILSDGYGYADREQKIAFTPATVAQIGSLTKQFTATAILELAAQDAVALDQPIKNYIPELTSSVGAVTIQQLLTHSSGLPEYCGDDFDRLSRDEFIRTCLSGPLKFEPGTDKAYSNVGYGAIAAIIEYVSGQNFEDYLLKTILRPNGLSSTGYYFAGDSELEFARGYLDGSDTGNIAEKLQAPGNEWWNLKGNGGMQASTLDMYAWYNTLNGTGVLG